LVGSTQVYLGVGSRHCHGINYTIYRVLSERREFMR
jgi:hypothetical protein